MQVVTLALAGYVLAALCFVLLAVLIVTSWRGGAPGALLLVACGITAAWAALMAAWSAGADIPHGALYLSEVLRNGAWIVMLAWLVPSEGWRSFGGLARVATCTVSAVAILATPFADGAARGALTLSGSGLLSTVLGLVLLEQLYRNARDAQRWAMKYLVVGVGALLAYDLFIYSHAQLFRTQQADLWAVRGYANAMVVPILAIAARRNPQLSVDLFVSRHVTFYSVALVGAGGYLLAMAAAGYGIRLLGGAWGAALQAMFLFGAIVLLGLIVLSGTMRSRLKVFIAKHFYANRYDYRDEWLRLTATLGESREPLGRRAIHALAQIVEAGGGVLWLRRELAGGNSVWEKSATWNSGGGPERLMPGDSLLDFVCRTNWSVDAKGVLRNPAAYDGLVLPDWMREFGPRALAVPLLADDSLYGLIVLREVRPGLDLSYEEIDLLRVAGRQAAVALAQAEADHLLTESRQFEAFNRLTAFLMHDLKNLIAQQSLVVRNAARFKHDPKFIDDAIETIDNSVRRMQRLLEQLRRSSVRQRAECVELASLLHAVVSEHGRRVPVPVLEVRGDQAAHVRAEPEGLHVIVGHVIRNAQDATATDGRVTVSLETHTGQAVIVVADTGSGMEPTFIRHRLFRPFDSTKGPKGMGIGAYQVRQFVEDAGGQVRVDSVPGAGTRFEIRLPLVESGEAEPAADPTPIPGEEQLASG